jgi:hypothetical protein
MLSDKRRFGSYLSIITRTVYGNQVRPILLQERDHTHTQNCTYRKLKTVLRSTRFV